MSQHFGGGCEEESPISQTQYQSCHYINCTFHFWVSPVCSCGQPLAFAYVNHARIHYWTRSVSPWALYQKNVLGSVQHLPVWRWLPTFQRNLLPLFSCLSFDLPGSYTMQYWIRLPTFQTNLLCLPLQKKWDGGIFHSIGPTKQEYWLITAKKEGIDSPAWVIRKWVGHEEDFMCLVSEVSTEKCLPCSSFLMDSDRTIHPLARSLVLIGQFSCSISLYLHLFYITYLNPSSHI